jgi:ABC-type multidrug transport system fused ATPase/permease subunit
MRCDLIKHLHFECKLHPPYGPQTPRPMDKLKISVGRYTVNLAKSLGHGTFAEVFLGTDDRVSRFVLWMCLLMRIPFSKHISKISSFSLLVSFLRFFLSYLPVFLPSIFSSLMDLIPLYSLLSQMILIIVIVVLFPLSVLAYLSRAPNTPSSAYTRAVSQSQQTASCSSRKSTFCASSTTGIS